MRYYTGTNWFIITYIQIMSNLQYLFPTSSLAVGCLEDMSPFAASNFDSPLAAQTEEARNGSEWHMNDIFAWIPAAFSCNLETCQRLMQLAHLFASQKGCLSFADAFPARRRWTSPPHQGKGRQPKWRSRLIWAQLLCLIERAMAEIFTSATQPLWVTEWLSGCSRNCGRVAEWLSGCSSHSGRVAEWLLQPLLAATVAEWLSGWVAASVTLAVWLSGWVAAPATLAEWLSGCISHSGRASEWLSGCGRVINQWNG